MTIESSPAELSADQPPPRKLNWILVIAALIAIGAIVVFRMTISHAAPAGARDTAQKFVDALSRGDEATAKALCDSSVDLAVMDRGMPQVRGWGLPKEMSPLIGIRHRGNASIESYDFSSDVEYAMLKHVYTVTVTLEGNDWKVSAYLIQ